MARFLDAITVAAAVGALFLGGSAYLRKSSSVPGVPRPIEVDDWEQYAAGGHRVGPADANVTVVEFGDYECPACRNVEPWLSTVRERYSDRVAFVYRHYPLSYHKMAFPAARAAECAARQGRFFEFHDLLFQETGWLVRPDLAFPDLARRASVADSAAFSECISAIQPVPSIDSDRAAGNALGIRGTPAVLINETLLAGLPDSTYLIEHIEKALRW